MNNSTMISIRDNLLAVRAELYKEIETLTGTQLNKKLSEDKWSVSQIIQHLILLDNVMLPRLRKTMQEESERVTEKNLDFLLDRSRKLESPLPEPSSEFINKEELWKAAKEARTPLLEFINECMNSTALEEKSMIHPLYGPLSIKQMIEFVCLHEKRHVEQIKEIKESV